MKKVLVILFLAITCFNDAFTQPVRPANAAAGGMSDERLARIDQTIQQYINSKWLNGAVAIVYRNGQLAYYKAIGYNDAENKIPMQKDNIFRIASQTKAVTSVAVMILFEEGKFLLDDAVSKYIPEFKNSRCWRNSMKPTAAIPPCPPSGK